MLRSGTRFCAQTSLSNLFLSLKHFQCMCSHRIMYRLQILFQISNITCRDLNINQIPRSGEENYFNVAYDTRISFLFPMYSKYVLDVKFFIQFELHILFLSFYKDVK